MRHLLAISLAAILLLRSGSAWAVVDKTSSANTSDPANGSPWGNVGNVNGASGIYLGDGWVLTAGHVGAGNFTLEIGTFVPAEGSAVALLNSDSTAADVILFRLQETPSLPAIAISSSSPTFATTVQFIGFGRTRGEAVTYGSLQGFAWSGQPSKSWGNNRVSSTTLVTAVNTQQFVTTFDRTGGTSHEAQGSLGDSGGGVFVQRFGTWELAGMVDAIGNVGDAGRPANTAFYGDVTYSADLATYRSQILSITGIPEPSAPSLLAAALPFCLSQVRRRRRQ